MESSSAQALLAALERFKGEHQEALQERVRLHSEFLQRYPFREHPEKIAELSPDEISRFLYWIEHRLKDLAHMNPGSDLYRRAASTNSEAFKKLLELAVDSSMDIANKIDADWGRIRGFGGDKQVAKKILFCYFPEKMLPILSTEHLEHFTRRLGLNYVHEAYNVYGKSYEMLSTGQKCELLNRMLLTYFGYQDTELNAYTTIALGSFLYEVIGGPERRVPPARKSRERAKPVRILAALFEPEYEQEILYFFALLHRDLGFPYVVRLRSQFPDAEVVDRDRKIRTIEFEVRASDFIRHGHPKDGCDFIVCWENDLKDPPEGMPKILALKELVRW